MAFFDPEAPLVIRRGKLPHWRQEGTIYFVTFRLSDSLPQTKLEWLRREKELWLRLNPEPRSNRQQREYHERFTQTVDRWLDAGYGRCVLNSSGPIWRHESFDHIIRSAEHLAKFEAYIRNNPMR